MGKNSRPPVNTSETNALQGLPIAKIDFYNLGGVVRKLVNAGNKAPFIHKELNENHLPEDAPKISLMAVYRWIESNIGDDYVDGRLSEEHAINTYNEEVKMLRTIDKQIAILEMLTDELGDSLSKSSDLKGDINKSKEIAFSLQKMIATKQALIVSIKHTQEMIFTFANFQEIIRIIMETVKEQDAVLHADIVEKIKSNVVLQEFYRKIEPKKN